MTINMARYSLLCITFFFCSASLLSQSWKVKQYTEENGLPSNYLYAVSHEKEKILIGSDAGLLLFDGRTFEIDNYFKNMYPIDLYRSTDTTLCVVTYRNGTFFKSPHSSKKVRSARSAIEVIGDNTDLVLYDRQMKRVDTNFATRDKTLWRLANQRILGYGLAADKKGVYYFHQKTLKLINWNGVEEEIKGINEDITTVFSAGELLLSLIHI